MSVDWFFTTQGRITRIVVGSLLIILGLGIIGGFIGVLLLIIGAVPIASAAYGTFLLAPFFGRDIRGNREGGAPVDEEPEPDEEGEDGQAREDESTQESGGARRGDEPSEEPQEQLEKDAPGDTTATRDESPSGTKPVRAERPPGQGARTKDLRAEDTGPGESG